jgi:hypothetical protein
MTSVHWVSTNFHSVILTRELCCHFGSVVRRGVINDEDTEVHRLAENAFDALAEEPTIVVARHDHIDLAHGKALRS